jgi:hypothetical protein
MLKEAEADEGTAEIEEGQVQIGQTFIADRQSSEAVEPGEGPLHDPPEPSELVAGFNATSSDATADAAMAQVVPTAWVVVALIGMQLVGSHTGRPRGRLIGSTALIRSSKTTESWTLAAVSQTASGMPWRSTRMWRLEPALPGSVGFGPTSWSAPPPFLPGRWTRPGWRATSRSCPLPPSGPVRRGGGGGRRQPAASRVAGLIAAGEDCQQVFGRVRRHGAAYRDPRSPADRCASAWMAATVKLRAMWLLPVPGGPAVRVRRARG